jgi:ABC-type phosphate transport system substrate-binding protein
MKRWLFNLFCLLVSLNLFGQTDNLGGLVLIGNSVGSQSLNVKKVKDIFKGKVASWPNNETVTLVMPSSKCSFAELYAKEVFGTSYTGVQKYWLALVFQGRASAPVFMQSSKEILEYIKQNPGAIALVDLNAKDIPSSYLIKLIP